MNQLQARDLNMTYFLYGNNNSVETKLEYIKMCKDRSITKVEADFSAITILSRGSKEGLPSQIREVKLLGWNQLKGVDFVVYHLGRLSYSFLENLRVLELSDCKMVCIPPAPDNTEIMIFRRCQFHRRRYELIKKFWKNNERIHLGENFELNLPKYLNELQLIDCERSKMDSECKKGEKFYVKSGEIGKFMNKHWVPIDDQLFTTFPETLESIRIDNASITDKTTKKLPATIKKTFFENCPYVK